MKATLRTDHEARTGWVSRLREVGRQQEAAYAPERGLGGYLGAISVFTGYCATLVVAGRVGGRTLPARLEPWDVALGAIATFRFSRLASKNAVTSPLRAPFTEYQGPGGPAETMEEARGTGVRRVVGELITCPFCVSVWTATTYTAGLVLAPRATRLAGSTLALIAGSDFLQLSYAALTHAAEED
jgi:hypothetical protein